MAIYVERLIRCDLDRLWSHTQDPALHERWDLRFTAIEYLPRTSSLDPQRFLYTTQIGLGVSVSGEGESVTRIEASNGERTSSLKFWSDERRSLIREGSGYWKYIPTADGIRFLTWYDYRTRFGGAGLAVDRLLFRPLLGWATAWSFDRLRLWLEERIEPETALRQTLVHAVARATLTFVFVYHGIVPKLLRHDTGELSMFRDAGVSASHVAAAINVTGLLEVGLASALLLRWNRAWPASIAVAAMAAATVAVAVFSPRFLTAAFNPISLNAAVAALAAIDILTLRGLPSAANCRRSPG